MTIIIGDKTHLTINTAARFLGTSMLAIRNAIAAGELTGYRTATGVGLTAGESARYVNTRQALQWWGAKKSKQTLQEISHE